MEIALTIGIVYGEVSRETPAPTVRRSPLTISLEEPVTVGQIAELGEFIVRGNNLLDNVTVMVTNPGVLRISELEGEPLYTITLVPDINGKVEETLMAYLVPNEEGIVSGNISVSSPGANSKILACSGFGIANTASTTLYLTDTANAVGYDLSDVHDNVTLASVGGVVEFGFLVYAPFPSSATWGEFEGSLTIKISGTLSDDLAFRLQRHNYPSLDDVHYSADYLITAGAGSKTININIEDWDDNTGKAGTPSDTDILMLVISSRPTFVETDSFTIDCTNPTDTYLTLDAELDPQAWPLP